MTILLQGAGLQTTTSTPADPIGDTLRADAVAYWKMDEASGTRIDATLRGNDLAQVNTPGNVIGKIGNAINLIHASHQKLVGPNNSDTQVVGASFAFAFWVNIRSVSPDYGYTFIDKADASGYYEYEVFYQKSLTNYGFYIAPPPPALSSMTVYSANGSATFGDWNFIVADFDVTTGLMRLSLNNGDFIVDTLADPIGLTDAPIQIGSDDNSSTNIWDADAYIDEVGFWKRRLTDGERSYLYNSGAGRALFP